ncbi:MAG: transcription antitermination factor NusB, partial [Eubacterium sp.]|nr:transcription antitermination factor NusB [Eubacterium sp.]
AKAITEKLDEIDKMLSEAAEGWSLKRIGNAELAILRVAIYEIKFDDDIPFKVAVNEAVELAKKYCEPEAASFINGVLAKFA